MRTLPQLIAASCLLFSAGALAGPARYPVNLDVAFTITGTSLFNGVDPAILTIESTDIKGKLNLTCSILSGIDSVTLTGTPKKHSGVGNGTFSETFFGDSGKYKASKI
jgi:hypothetical protein